MNVLNMKKYIVLNFLLVGILSVGQGQNIKEELNKELADLYEASALSGFSVAIVNGEGTLYQESYGYEYIADKKKFSHQQRFNIASISKTFIGIGLMKLVEEGKLELSTPINKLLPFRVVNPNYPAVNITVEHLANHTSSIIDDDIEKETWYLDQELELSKKSIWKVAYKDFSNWNENKQEKLGFFLRDALSDRGTHFSNKRFANKKPGEQYAYSNLGAALAAYIIELASGLSYDDYLEDLVAKELGFPTGIWKHRSNSIPTSYFQNQVVIPVYRPILYPTGGMMLSCEELSIYLIEMVNGYLGKSKILKATSFQKMMNAKDGAEKQQGVFWELKGNKIGHNGGNYGVTCFMSFDKETGIGKIFITNISSYKNDELLKEMIGVWNKLAEFESTL